MCTTHVHLFTVYTSTDTNNVLLSFIKWHTIAVCGVDSEVVMTTRILIITGCTVMQAPC